MLIAGALNIPSLKVTQNSRAQFLLSSIRKSQTLYVFSLKLSNNDTSTCIITVECQHLSCLHEIFGKNAREKLQMESESILGYFYFYLVFNAELKWFAFFFFHCRSFNYSPLCERIRRLGLPWIFLDVHQYETVLDTFAFWLYGV